MKTPQEIFNIPVIVATVDTVVTVATVATAATVATVAIKAPLTYVILRNALRKLKRQWSQLLFV